MERVKNIVRTAERRQAEKIVYELAAMPMIVESRSKQPWWSGATTVARAQHWSDLLYCKEGVYRIQ